MKLIFGTMKLFFREKFHRDLSKRKTGELESLNFDFCMFNFDTIKTNLTSKNAEKPCTKPLLLKRKGTQVSYQYLRSNMVRATGLEPARSRSGT